MSNFKVKLIWITPDIEKHIIYCARVSSDNQDNPEIEKLIKYCIKNNHWSIFEMGNMCIEVIAPLFVINQILRHKSFSFQQFSMRYNTVDKITDDIYIPEFRQKNKSNRQSSEHIHYNNDYYKNEFIRINNESLELYNKMLNDNVANECARNIINISQMSKIYINGSIRSWIHYLQIRTDQHSQKEHREVGLLKKNIFKENVPIIYNSVFNL